MKKILAIILLSALLLSSCSAPHDSQNDTESAGETAVTESDSPYAAIENSTEQWLKIGLEAYQAGSIPEFDAAAFFLENPNNIQYLSLCNDMYICGKESFEQISVLLYRFIHDTYGYDALFDPEKRVEYKDAWLKSLDPSLSYTNQPDAEAILSTMVCTSDSMYDYIITLDGVTYSFYDYETVSPSLAHMIIYYNTLALRTLKSELAAIDPEGLLFDTTAPLRYVMSFENTVSVSAADGTYHVSRYEDMLTGAVSMMTHDDDPDAHWITAGLAEIYGKARGTYYLTTYDRVFYLMPEYLENYIQPMADEGNPAGVYYLGVAAYYHSLNGLMYKDENGLYVIDNMLYTDAAAMSDLQIGYQPLLRDLYVVRSDGGELSRVQAGAFVQWLTGEYGLDAVLSMAKDYDQFEAVCGADYDSVKAAWRLSLEEKFA